MCIEARLTSAAAAIASLWAIACLAVEHGLGVYLPSETTGAGSNLGAFAGLLVTLAVVARAASRTGRLARGTTGALVSVAVGASLASAKYVYFEFYLGDFPAQMERFTATTLAGRGQPAADVAAFAELVASSWGSFNVAYNTFMMFSVWGTGIAVLLAFIAPMLRQGD